MISVNDYKKSDFYHFYDLEKEKRRYFIKVQGKFIEVDKEVYYTCFNSYRKQIRTNRKEEKYGIISYDHMLSDGYDLLDSLGKEYNYLDELYKKELLKKLLYLIGKLDSQDKKLIKELMIDNKRERELADRYHVKQQTINAKKKRILRYLKSRLKEGDIK